jgi:cytochrome c oxidase assembly protein subunit 11
MIGFRHGRILIAGGITICLMLALAFASVPLYRKFCQVTGYGGTTQRAEIAPGETGSRTITVRFNTMVNPGLPWRFVPDQPSVTIKLGESALATFTAANKSASPVTGQATFNVTPLKAGIYFDKTQCFCFTEQTLEAGATVHMPVSFFIDPAITQDHNLDDVDTITLSYSFFRKPGDKSDVTN